MMIQPTLQECEILDQINKTKNSEEVGELLKKLAEIHHEVNKKYNGIALAH